MLSIEGVSRTEEDDLATQVKMLTQWAGNCWTLHASRDAREESSVFSQREQNSSWREGESIVSVHCFYCSNSLLLPHLCYAINCLYILDVYYYAINIELIWGSNMIHFLGYFCLYYPCTSWLVRPTISWDNVILKGFHALYFMDSYLFYCMSLDWQDNNAQES